MTVTLTQARARVRFLIDDADANPLVSDAEIDVALATAQEEVWQRVVGSGVNVYTQHADISSSAAGVVNLSSLNPMKVVSVAWKSGNTFMQVPPSRPGDFIQTVAQVQALRVVYVPRATFPALAADPFVWATASISSPTLDQLLCVVAAADVWVKTGEGPLASLEQRKAELQKSIDEQISIPGWSVAPLRATSRFPSHRYAGFQWVMTGANQMQLVYA